MEGPTVSGTSSVRVTAERLARFDRPGPRYTGYPMPPVWTEGFLDTELQEALRGADKDPAPLSLYLHVPFCSGDAEKLPLVCSGPLEAGQHFVPLGNLLFHGKMQVGKPTPH